MRLLSAAALLVVTGCLYSPSERFACSSDSDCTLIGGRCDVAAQTCVVGPVSILDASVTTEMPDAARVPDASSVDAAMRDAAMSDAAMGDSAVPDDAGSADASRADGGCGERADGGNSRPNVQPDMVRGFEDTVIVVDVLANDCDPDGDMLRVSSVVGMGSSRVAIDNNRLRYTPPSDFFGTVMFDYVVEDGVGGNALGTVTIEVQPVNDAPQVQNLQAQYRASPMNGRLVGVDRDNDAITFLISDPPQHGTVTLVDPATGQFEYRLVPTDGGTPPGFDFFTFQAEDPSGLLSPLGRVDILIASTGIYDIEWQGDVVGAQRRWDEPGNWSTDALPQPGDRVLIPAMRPQPQLSASTEIAEIFVESGSGLELTGEDVTLTVHGTVLGIGPIRGLGKVAVDGFNARIAGTFPELDVLAQSVLVGPTTVARELHVTAPLTLANWVIDVGGTLLVDGQGSIAMQQPTDRVICEADCVFAGVDSTGLASNGTLEVHGLLHIVGPGLIATGTHVTEFAGSATTLRMDRGYAGELHDVRVLGGTFEAVQSSDNMPGVIRAKGNVEVLGNATVLGDNGMTLAVTGDLISEPNTNIAIPVLFLEGPAGTTLAEGVLAQDTLVLSGLTEQVLTAGVYNKVQAQGPVLVEPGTIADDFQAVAPTARVVVPGLLTVRNLDMTGNSSFVMQQPEARVLVTGNANLEGAQPPGLMTAGEIEVHGNVRIVGIGVVASGTHRLILGTGMETAGATQTLNVMDTANMGAINHLELRNANGTHIASWLKVHGELKVACTTCANVADPMTRVEVVGPFIKPAMGTFTFSSLVLEDPSGTTQIGGGLSAQTLTMAGTDQVLKTLPGYVNVTISGPRVVTQGVLSASGLLLVDSPANAAAPAALVLGAETTVGALTVKDNGIFRAEGFPVVITGDLRTETGGTLETREGTDSVTVGGNAVLFGANPGVQSNGVLQVGGRLDVSMGSFTAGPNHRVVLPAGNADHEVTLGAMSSLHDVEVRGSTRFSSSGTVTGRLSGFSPATITVDTGVTLTVGVLNMQGATLVNNGTINAMMCQPAGPMATGNQPVCGM